MMDSRRSIHGGGIVMKRVLSLAAALTLLGLVFGCGSSSKNTAPANPVAAQQEVDAGNAALAAGDYATANTHFKNAIAQNPGNSQAQFGAAVTEVYLLQSDPDVQAVGGQFNLLRAGGMSLGHTRTARRAAL